MPEAAFCILIFYMETPFRLIQWKFFSVHAADFDVTVLAESLNYHINFFRQIHCAPNQSHQNAPPDATCDSGIPHPGHIR